MPVKLTILSGAREGECFNFDTAAFRIGDDPDAEIRLDPRRDPAARGCLALVRYEVSGWRIENKGDGRLMLNHTVVEGGAPLRSGDIIRLSDMGPDICFRLAGRLQSNPLYDEAPKTALLDRETGTEVKQVVTLPMRLRSMMRGWYLLTSCVILLLAVFVVRNLPSHRVPDDPALMTEKRGEDDGAVDQEVPPEESTQEVEWAAVPDQLPDVPIAPESGEKLDVSAQVTDPDAGLPRPKLVKATVCLLLVETADREHSFPVGTACVIREDLLLTNALVVVEMQRKRAAGWHLLAFWPHDGKHSPLGELLVHRAFAETDELAEERVFWELGLVGLEGNHTPVAPLATPEELAKLEAGVSLACLGVPHSGRRRTQLDAFRVESHPVELYGKIRLVDTNPTHSTGAPALLTLVPASPHGAVTGKDRLPENLYGSPIVNSTGHVIGVYAERAATDFELHYAPQIILVHTYLAGQGLDHWMEAE